MSVDLERQAFEHAKRQAQVFADAAGAKLGQVISISYPPRVEYVASRGEADLPSRRAVTQVPVEVGLVTYDAEVDVKWALE